MKLNLTLIKLTIRLLILMILFVMLFLISAFLYSARYWPDVYNYINANITIKRIPTITELNLTVIEVVEYKTEGYSSTDMDSTNDYDSNTEEYSFTFAFEDLSFPKSKYKRSAVLEDMGNDFSEVPKKGVLVDYFFVDEDGSMTKLMTDSVDVRQLTKSNSEDVEVMAETKGFGRFPKLTIESRHGDKPQVTSAVFPWIATIFLRNEAKGDQFDYVCDGALVSEKIVLTAARCVLNNTSVMDPENFIVILGKTSLQVSGGEEKILKVSAVKPHENFTFTDGIATNDLAMLVLKDPVVLNEGIATACLPTVDQTADENIEEALTTAWNLQGDLTLVYFDKEESKACGSGNKVENTFCATYGNEVALCPSYGGLYVTISADSRLHLQGLRTGNPQDRGVCYDKNVNYTSLNSYHKWIQNTIEANK